MRHTTLRRSLILIALVAAPTLLAGCATNRLAFNKSGTTASERKHDEAACLRASADDPGRAQLLAAYRIDREAYAQCMNARGYRLVS